MRTDHLKCPQCRHVVQKKGKTQMLFACMHCNLRFLVTAPKMLLESSDIDAAIKARNKIKEQSRATCAIRWRSKTKDKFEAARQLLRERVYETAKR